MKSRTEGDLQELLLRCCRPDDKGRKSIPRLADQLGLASFTIYKWVKGNHIPHWRATQLVSHAQGEVTLEEFIPYLFRT